LRNLFKNIFQAKIQKKFSATFLEQKYFTADEGGRKKMSEQHLETGLIKSSKRGSQSKCHNKAPY
jgi:phage antirepressor YoqD-like protein